MFSIEILPYYTIVYTSVLFRIVPYCTVQYSTVVRVQQKFRGSRMLNPRSLGLVHKSARSKLTCCPAVWRWSRWWL